MSIINSLVLSETQQIEIEYKGENGVGFTRLIILTQELCIIYFSILSPAQCLARRGMRNEWMNGQVNALFFTLCDIYSSKFTNKPRDIFFKPSKNCLGICDFLSLWGSPLLFDNCGSGGRWRKIGKNPKRENLVVSLFLIDGVTDHFPYLNTCMACELWATWQMAGSLSWDLSCIVGLDRNRSSMWLLTHCLWVIAPSAPWLSPSWVQHRRW